MQSTTAQRTKSSFVFKGGLHAFTSLQLLTHDLPQFEVELLKKIEQAPAFFQYAPVILDCTKLEGDCDLAAILTIVKNAKLYPIGLKTASLAQRDAARDLSLPVLPYDAHSAVEVGATSPASATPAKEQEGPGAPTRIITQPVRSGQQIYARKADLIVLAPVSHGAELLADGNIHIYAPLRGRALAGVLGDKNTYIFCQSLEAELISVAGHYRLSEDLKDRGWKTSVKIYLEEDHLQIAPL